MEPNPVLKKLGYSPDDRLVIIHTDDIGMCHASISAFQELFEFGVITSGAVMVPCAWFPHTAAYCRQNTQADLGVHLTLTSEWDAYRWGPISTREAASGLLDAEGYFYRSAEEAQLNGNPEAVQAELDAQINRAKSQGINVSHIDTHMGTVAHPKFIAGYVQLAVQHHIPAMISRKDEAGYRMLGLDHESARFAAEFAVQLEALGVPLIDEITGLDLDRPDNRLDYAKSVLAGLPAGITHFVIHPSKDTPELRAITPDWRSRVADYQTFSSEAMRIFLREQGLQTIGYHALRKLMIS